MSSLPLFVYGTLLVGQQQAGLLGELRRERAMVRGTLYRMPGGSPALALTGDTKITGELVYEVEDALWGVLDFYEGVHEGLYRRCETTANLGLRPVRCLVYEMDRPELRGGRLVRSGHWRQRRG